MPRRYPPGVRCEDVTVLSSLDHVPDLMLCVNSMHGAGHDGGPAREFKLFSADRRKCWWAQVWERVSARTRLGTNFDASSADGKSKFCTAYNRQMLVCGFTVNMFF